ncbi:MAG TPA: hypothetical protein DCE56_13040 [Cyanobacteria bacterium UBA8553]|nr:hypothetical protein [Cyanobacteria bacterium UBA8553]
MKKFINRSLIKQPALTFAEPFSEEVAEASVHRTSSKVTAIASSPHTKDDRTIIQTKCDRIFTSCIQAIAPHPFQLRSHLHLIPKRDRTIIQTKCDRLFTSSKNKKGDRFSEFLSHSTSNVSSCLLP